MKLNVLLRTRRAGGLLWLLLFALLALAGALPGGAFAAPPAALDLAFDGTGGGILNTGFTNALPGTTEVDSALTLSSGKLHIAASAGDLAPSTLPQENALAVSYTSSGAYTIGARILKPAFGSAYQSAGIFIGQSNTKYIRFSAGLGWKGSLGERLQLDVMDSNGKLRSSTIALPAGTLASIQSSLDLFLNIDHTGNGKITALYRIDSDNAADGRLATSRSFPRWLRQGNNVAVFAGMLATNRGASVPLGVDFDWFRVTTAPQAVAVVAGSKTVDKDGLSNGQSVLPGDTLTYTINVQNNGTSTNVQVTDPIPTDTTYVAGSVTNSATYDAATNRILWSGTLAQSGTATFTFKAKINTTLQSSTIANTASVTSGASPLPSLLSAQTVVGSTPDLSSSTYAASPASVGPNGTITYTLSLLNDGTAPANAPTAQLLVPGGTTLQAGSASASRGTLSIDPSLTQLHWSSATPLAVNDSATISFVVKVGSSFANGAAIVSQASIQASGIATTVQSAQAIFSAPSSVIGSKVVDKAQANRGDTLTYTIAIKNNSGTPASNLQVVDPLPQDVTFVNNSLTTPALGTATIDSSKRTVTWNIPTLAAGATDAITLSVTINTLLHSAVIPNNAVLTNPSASVPQTLLIASTVVQNAADLSSSLYTASPAQLTNGGTATYTLNLVNNGTGAASNATAQLTIPASMTLVANSAVASRGSVTVNTALNSMTWSAGAPLPIGTVVTISFRAKVGTAITGGYLSKATLQADGTAPIIKTAVTSLVQSAPNSRRLYIPVARRI